MSSINQKERVRADYSPSLQQAAYSPSLQQAAKALWGDDFWGSFAPRPLDAAAPPVRRGR